MKLEFIKDTKCGILSYQINGNEEFIAFDNVLREKGVKYRMAICADSSHKLVKVELLS